MIDIIEITDDIKFADSDVPKAANVLSIQLGDLTYQQDLGIDLRYFLSEQFAFQNASFKSYLLQRLAESSINVQSVLELVEALYAKYTFNISPTETGPGLVVG